MMKCVSFLIFLTGFILFLTQPKNVFAAASCGQWGWTQTVCLQSTGDGQPATCSPLTYTCPNGQTAYYCGPPLPSEICQIPGQDPGGNGPGVNSATFTKFNQAIFGGDPDVQLTTPRGIISKLLPYLFTFAGLILFVMIIWGGFEMLTGAANPKSQEAGKQRITAAIIGFLFLFSSYWLAQIVERVFGISIL